MRRIGKFLRLRTADRRLLIESLLVLSVIKLGLWFLPFRVLRLLIAKAIGPTADLKKPEPRSIRNVAWAIGIVSGRLPIFTNCLNRALATQVMFGRRRRSVDLKIGVTRDPKGKLKAHAWIESAGRIVVGEVTDHALYVPLPSLEGKGL